MKNADFHYAMFVLDNEIDELHECIKAMESHACLADSVRRDRERIKHLLRVSEWMRQQYLGELSQRPKVRAA